MCTANALANSYENGREVILSDRRPDDTSIDETNYLFAQCCGQQFTRLNTKTAEVVLEKEFQLIRTEPFEIVEKWRVFFFCFLLE